ncbi:MAG: polysaccharide deacetylase family protein [Pirellulales bacterium]
MLHKPPISAPSANRSTAIAWWSQALLGGYYAALTPYRWSCRRRWQQRGDAPVLVAMYHRVADDLATPWTVSNAMFARQIDWLRANVDLISLAEAQRRIREGNRRVAVAITFDDGYADNCDAALPLLVRHRLPCTYFVTSQNILEQRPFEHDLALGVRHAPNTTEQIRALAESGIDIGGHTRTHADLGKIADRDTLREEIAGGAAELAAITSGPVRYFAFPFGQKVNLSATAFDVARQAGLDAVCSAYGGFNHPGDDPFHLQRFAVDNDLVRLKNWCGVDPRKLRKHPRFDFPATEQSRESILIGSAPPASASTR